ncbi:MAG: VOC family protein [Planctomycetota bacterium]|jgi:catechol 2,3-dioxygenase-like lactoylglutathione lyase family enzyme
MADLKGFGGVFIYSNEPLKLREWYRSTFGLEFEGDPEGKFSYLSFAAGDLQNPGDKVFTVFSIFQAEEPLEGPRREYRVNFRVDDAASLFARLELEGLELEPFEEHPEGKFFWARDPDGNRLEFWEPGDVGEF